MNDIKGIFKIISKPILTIIVALLIGVILILLTSTSPLEAYSVLFKGAFGSVPNILDTLARSTPLIFMGLAASFAFRGGVFNIGLEGQMYLGAITSALIGIYFGQLPSIILIPLCLLGAGIAGSIWSFIPGILKVKYNVHIVITSIMMNEIAVLLTTYLSSYKFKGDLPIAATHIVSDNAKLFRFTPTSELNAGFILAIIIAIILYIVVFKTKYGYEVRSLGLNEKFTEYIGVNVGRKTLIIVFISSFIAGLGGAEQILGVSYRFISEFSPGYGFNGITVALLGSLHPIGTIIGGIFFGALSSGAIRMEVMTDVSRELISSLQAIMILLLAAEHLIRFKKKKIKGKGELIK